MNTVDSTKLKQGKKTYAGANISASIITKIKNGQYIALDKVESICHAMSCTPNDMLEFTPDNPEGA